MQKNEKFVFTAIFIAAIIALFIILDSGLHSENPTYYKVEDNKPVIINEGHKDSLTLPPAR